VNGASGSWRPRAAALLCLAIGAAALGLALASGGLLPWLLTSFLLLGARFQLWPRPGDLRRVLRLVGALLAALALFFAGIVGLWETAEVIQLRQRDESGQWFATRLWIVDLEGAPSFLARPPDEHRRVGLLRDQPRVELVRGGRAECRVASLESPSDAVRAEAERLYREKYGFRVYVAGRLMGLLLGGRSDRPEILVRLEPCEDGP